jgi:hypothetical protein
MRLPDQARAVVRTQYGVSRPHDRMDESAGAAAGVAPSIICPEPPCAWYFCSGGNYYLCCESGLLDPAANPCACAG